MSYERDLAYVEDMAYAGETTNKDVQLALKRLRRHLERLEKMLRENARTA